jgi:hypothetical protein
VFTAFLTYSSFTPRSITTEIAIPLRSGPFPPSPAKERAEIRLEAKIVMIATESFTKLLFLTVANIEFSILNLGSNIKANQAVIN